MVPFVLLYPSKDTVYVFLQRGTDQEFFSNRVVQDVRREEILCPLEFQHCDIRAGKDFGLKGNA